MHGLPTCNKGTFHLFGAQSGDAAQQPGAARAAAAAAGAAAAAVAAAIEGRQVGGTWSVQHQLQPPSSISCDKPATRHSSSAHLHHRAALLALLPAFLGLAPARQAGGRAQQPQHRPAASRPLQLLPAAAACLVHSPPPGAAPCAGAPVSADDGDTGERLLPAVLLLLGRPPAAAAAATPGPPCSRQRAAGGTLGGGGGGTAGGGGSGDSRGWGRSRGHCGSSEPMHVKARRNSGPPLAAGPCSTRLRAAFTPAGLPAAGRPPR